MAPTSPKMQKFDPQDCIYEPITSVEALLKYSQLAESTSTSINKPCLDKTIPRSTHFGHTKLQTNGQRSDASKCPKLMVCHDFCGGYLDDRFVNGTSNPYNYTFRHWLQTDIFVYFAHKFVTIPPLGWINSAHAHGVRILGTIITEWNDGVVICNKMLNDSPTIDKAVENLTLINSDYGFDGYLINIENPMKNGTERLIEFVDKLTKSLKESSCDNLVIWYDSVIVNGDLKWQDELNENNRDFFNVCDGVYLNYGWNDEKLQNSVNMAGDRKFDVYVGIDVFGRGCFGGGGFNTCEAVEKVYKYGLSIAMFAPGWTFETCKNIAEYPERDDKMWDKCAKYLYFSCWKWNESFESRATEKPDFQLLLWSDFSRGFGQNRFQLGTESKAGTWFNLSLQSYQPFLYNFKSSSDESEGISNVEFNTSIGCFGGGCLLLKDTENIADTALKTNYFPAISSASKYKIYIPLDITLKKYRPPSPKDKEVIALLVIWKKLDESKTDKSSQLRVCVEVDNRQGVQCTEYAMTPGKSDLSQVTFLKKVPLLEFIIPGLSSSSSLSELLNISNASTTCGQEFDGWELGCVLIQPGHYSSMSDSETETLNGIFLGNDGEICVGYFALAKIDAGSGLPD